MYNTLETERLILRRLTPDDDKGMFELDSNPEVHRFLGEKPIKTIEEARKVIEIIRKQYDENGIGRSAVIEKSSGHFIGWSGLKFITIPENNKVNYHDVGYRLIPRYWGKGYATESAKAAIAYGFQQMNLKEIIGAANVDNKASRKTLEKCGLKFIEQFMWHDLRCDWLSITREEWEEKRKDAIHRVSLSE